MKKTKIDTVKELLESAENSLRSAKLMLAEITNASPDIIKEKSETETQELTPDSKIIEGEFDGELMIGAGGKKYPVPPNYASKSKLVLGDRLKLTIAPDGSFIYKQIGPVERKKLVGTLLSENGQYRVVAGGKSYKVLLASVTYFKVISGDEVTVVVPSDRESSWAAIESAVIRPENSDLAIESSTNGPGD